MNFADMKLSPKTLHIADVRCTFDVREDGHIDLEHRDNIALLVAANGGKLKDTPIVDLNNELLTSRHGKRGLEKYFEDAHVNTVDRFLGVNVLPVKVAELTQKQVSSLRAWCAGFDIVGSLDAKRPLTVQDFRAIVKDMLRSGHTPATVRSSFPPTLANLLDTIIKQAPAAIMQENAIAAVITFLAGDVTKTQAMKQHGLDPKKHKKYFESKLAQKLGKKVVGGKSLNDRTHLFQYYSRSGNNHEKQVREHCATWYKAYREGMTLTSWGNSRDFPPQLWSDLIENEQALLNSIQSGLNDARARMQATVSKGSLQAKAAGAGKI